MTASSLASSIVDRFGAQAPAVLERITSEMAPKDLEALLFEWRFWARPEQLAPEGDWDTWLLCAGLGFGKTRTGAEWVRYGVERLGVSRIVLVGATQADVRDTMIEGESGLIAIAPRGFRPVYESSKARLTWPNGAYALCRSAEEPDRLRGPAFEYGWADELAAWKNLVETWNILIGRMRHGAHPRLCVTTTPQRLALLRELAADETTVTVYGSTTTNIFMPASYKRKLNKYVPGSELWRQEVEGEILDDRKGALFDATWIKRIATEPSLRRVVVAVDPAISTNRHSDQTGIVIAGAGYDERGYLLADVSGKYSPDAWGKKVVEAYDEHEADCVVVETNRGGDMVANTIRTTLKSMGRNPQSIRIIEVRAMRGKALRAEPIAALYQAGRVSHVGPAATWAALEQEMIDWDPALAVEKKAKSPNRLDAMVFALSELELGVDVRAGFDGLEEANERITRGFRPQYPGELEDESPAEEEDERDAYGGGGDFGGPMLIG